ncbi:sensor histidine kinase [Alkalihalobacterium chitinilyticum]|uniref:histidine kinase n=1 Tax=Alkalihalobacterium chitinilyticum TaxID=2980103 RepID=A0ABT5VCR6_9BACI|nr:HAMP domain-containing sensor histidine kinase [Alkalihalobacterium chitinilyticum]MDE5413238.1 HAMP domain-containing histidine kinase [Alkalihalobacterium chitinilyticum]
MRVNKLRNKLIIKLLGAIAISFFVSYCVMVLNALLFRYLYDSGYFDMESVLHFNFMNLFTFTTGILSFIAAFLLLVRKKVAYLKLISDSVNHIANGSLGLTIKAEGKDELTQLAENINFMSKELENKFEHERRLEAAKNELITNVSHDLRTPLTSMIGYLDLLKKGQYEGKKQFDEYVETTYSKSLRLKTLIDELFEYTRLSDLDVKLNLVEVDVTALLEQIVGEYIPIFEREHLSVKKNITDEHVPVLLDIEKFVRVYENLFMNAIKYSIKPSDIRISLEAKGSKAVFKVSNRVDQPPVEDVNKLFGRFFTGDKARSENRGTGLGLAISKRIVELHKGSIGVEYKEGWMTFYVEHTIH